MEERIPLTVRQTSNRSYPPPEVRDRNMAGTIDDGSLELLEHLIAIVLQGNSQYLETLLRNEEILEVLDLHDNKGFTALHIAAERVDSECVRLLLEADANPNVMDRFRRTALHWAVSGGCHCNFCDTKRSKCVELLLRAKGNLELKDVKGEVPLSYAAKNMFHKAAEVLLNHGAETNQVCNGVKLINLIIQKIPEVVIHLLDQNVDYDQEDNSKLKIDFSVLLQCPLQKKEEDDEEKHIYALLDKNLTGKKSEMELLNLFLKTNSVMSKALLTHPLTLAFIHLKWMYVRKWIWFIRIFYFVFTAIFTYFTFDFYFVQCPYDNGKKSKINNDLVEETTTMVLNSTSHEHHSCTPGLKFFVIGISLAVWVIYIVVTRIYTMAHKCGKYLQIWSNIGWGILIGCITVTILPAFGILQVPALWQYIIACIGVFFAWIINFSHFCDIPFFGTYAKMLTKVLCKTLIVGLVFSSIFIAFLFGFSVILSRIFHLIPESIESLRQIFLSLGKYGVYFTLFDSALESWSVESNEFWGFTNISYIVFIIVFGIGLMNLLIALAVADIQEIQRHADIIHIRSQIAAISHIESLVSDNWFGSCVQKYIFSQISVKYRNGRNLRFSPMNSKDNSLPSEIKERFIPLLHTRHCLNKPEILNQSPVRPTMINHNNFGFHRNNPRVVNHVQKNFLTTSAQDNIDEILNELKIKLEGLQRRRLVSSPVFC